MMLIWFPKKQWSQFFAGGTNYDFHSAVGLLYLASFISNSFNTCSGFISDSERRPDFALTTEGRFEKWNMVSSRQKSKKCLLEWNGGTRKFTCMRSEYFWFSYSRFQYYFRKSVICYVPISHNISQFSHSFRFLHCIKVEKEERFFFSDFSTYLEVYGLLPEANFDSTLSSI